MRFEKRYLLLACALLLPLVVSCAAKTPELKPLPGDVTNVTNETFAAQVLNHDGPALVLFYDENPPSTDMHRRFIEFAQRFGEPIKFCRYKWAEGDDPTLYGLEALPTVVLYKKGYEIDRIKGIPPKTKDYMDWDEDVELWLLRNALDLRADEYTATYECWFKNSYELKFSNY